jgi:carboxypeptidase T
MLKLIILFQAAIVSFNAFAHSHSAPFAPILPIVNESDRDAFNRRYSDIQLMMKDIETKFPHVAKVFDLGMNDTGQMIQGIALGAGPVNNLIVGTHHGNEYGSTEVAIAAIKHFAEAPIAGQTIHVIPVLNVSGYDRRSRSEIGRDPNRDYPGPCDTAGPFALRSTKLLAEFIAQKNIVASVTLHTFSPAVLYPWGISTKDLKTEYDDLFIELGNFAAIESKYEVGNSTALLYPADGTFEDYAFWKEGVWSLLFEMGFSHSPKQSAIDTMINGNIPGLHRFFEKAPTQRAEKHDFVGKCDTNLRARGERQD